MPQTIQYKAHSVIYIAGDSSQHIYILQTGRVALVSIDSETGKEVTDLVGAGEFFGVQSALGHYPRHDTAIILQESTCLMLSCLEFEALASKNIRVVMKMLRVFSRQLRSIHAKVRNLLNVGGRESPEAGLFHTAQYYLAQQNYPHALYILKKYLQHFPNGEYQIEATKCLQQAEQSTQQSSAGDTVSGIETGDQSRAGKSTIQSGAGKSTIQSGAGKSTAISSVEEEEYYHAANLLLREDYQQAVKVLTAIIKQGEGHPYLINAHLDLPKALLGMKKADICINHLQRFIKNFSGSRRIPEALVYLADAYGQKGATEESTKIYQQALASPTIDEVSQRRAMAALRKAEGGL